MARLLVCVTGSVAAIRTTDLIEKIGGKGYELRMVLTRSADFFLPDWQSVNSTDRIPVFRDHDEWPENGWNRGDQVLHIELRRWADAMLIAPLDAHTLAKWSMGLADNLLSSVIRAWDFQKPVLFAPAMNTFMWDSAITRRQLAQILADLEERPIDLHKIPSIDEIINSFSRLKKPVRIIPPVEKTLACGDQGMGGMASLDEILRVVQQFVEPNLAME